MGANSALLEPPVKVETAVSEELAEPAKAWSRPPEPPPREQSRDDAEAQVRFDRD